MKKIYASLLPVMFLASVSCVSTTSTSLKTPNLTNPHPDSAIVIITHLSPLIKEVKNPYLVGVTKEEQAFRNKNKSGDINFKKYDTFLAKYSRKESKAKIYDHKPFTPTANSGVSK